MLPPIPSNEPKRLAALYRLDLLDTPPEPALDRLTRLAASALDVSFALISLIDEQRQWFKSSFGLSLREIPRNGSFCAHAIVADDVLVVADATRDQRFPKQINGSWRFDCGVRRGWRCMALDFEPNEKFG